MPYIGKSPSGLGVRTRFLYTATASQTTFSGADTQNLTLSYSDSNFIDVHQNGVLLKIVDDYTATSGTSVVLGTGATADDVIEITVYDIFTVANHVKKSGDVMTGLLEITRSDTNAQLRLTTTDASATEGPVLELFRNSDTPADSDDLGVIRFIGRNNHISGEEEVYAKIKAETRDITDATEDGYIDFSIQVNSTLRNMLEIGASEVVINEESVDVDFRVESDGNTHMLLVDAGNNHVNIGTSTDRGGVLNVESTDTNDTLVLTSTDSGSDEGPILKLERISSSPADSDVLGKIKFNGQNDAGESVEYGNIDMRLSSSSGVADGAETSRMIFRTMLNGSLNSRIDIQSDETVFNEGSQDVNFRIESNAVSNIFNVDAGNDSVRIGNNNIPETATTRVVINGNSTNRALDIDRSTTTTTADTVRLYSNVGGTNTNTATIEANGDFLSATNSYGSLSDERFKQDIVDSGSQWDDVKAMRIRKYRRKNMVATEGDNAPVEIGVIAQELESSDMGGLVKTNPKDDENKEEFKTVKYTVLYMKAVKALQEAMARIETLEAKVTALESK